MAENTKVKEKIDWQMISKWTHVELRTMGLVENLGNGIVIVEVGPISGWFSNGPL